MRRVQSDDDSLKPVSVRIGHVISIREPIVRLSGYHGEIRWDATRREGQPPRRSDASPARERSGLVALTSFEDGLPRTIEWQRHA